MSELIIALPEEIGNPDLFTGRREEMAFYLDWAENSKKLLSKSCALLSRRKMGKTALVQRLYNILYSRNDPRLVPFFYRVPEHDMSVQALGLEFYQAFLTQFLAFRLRRSDLAKRMLGLKALRELVKDDPVLLGDIRDMEEMISTNLELVWGHAQKAPQRLAAILDIRVIQIIDEFQYLNRFVYNVNFEKRIDLCHSYMGPAENKHAPLLVTGSFIGWLMTILNHMTARFNYRQLGSLTDEEALEAVYNYAAILGRPVTEETAPYIAEVAFNDPFYISQIIRTDQPDHDVTTLAGVRAALQFETTFSKGHTANVWMEYIAEGISRVNDVNGKKIVLYLARYGEEERTRRQIKEDLSLDITDEALADRLHVLHQADLIGAGSSDFHFKGLGDPIFAAVFRKRYGVEIEQVTPAQVKADFEEEMKRARRRAAWYKGLAGEYRVLYFLLSAAHLSTPAEDVLHGVIAGFSLSGLRSMGKHSFHWGQAASDEVDIYARSAEPDDYDLIVEVKTWDRVVSNDAVDSFVAKKKRLQALLKDKTAFLFYSEMGFTPEQQARLREQRIMFTTHEKLMGRSEA